jgi:hypothetical protein
VVVIVIELMSVRLDREFLEDVEKMISDELTKGKNCGGLRKSDSHAMRIKYLFNYWKNEVVFHGADRRLAELEAEKMDRDVLKSQLRKEIMDELKKKLE